MRTIVTFIAMLGGMAAVMGDHKAYDNDRVIWPNSRESAEKVAAFKVTPEAASQILTENSERLRGFVGYKHWPGTIIGDYYRFGLAGKPNPRLQSVYVNGFTGRVELRYSTKSLKAGARSLPADPWDKIEVVELKKPSD